MPAVMITGASRGFGRALMNTYLAKGWTVIPLVRYINTILDAVNQYPGRCFPVHGDVTSDNIDHSIKSILREKKITLDVLINNAGYIKKLRSFEETVPEDLKALFDVHCVGVLQVSKAALPYLRKSDNPRIINISSRWGSISMTASGIGGRIYSYNMAKSAQNMLTVMMHQEFKPENIKIFAVHPGRLTTSVAAPDADVHPELAAEKLFEWVENISEKTENKLYDLMECTTSDW